MIDFLNSFKSLVKLEKIHTDNNVFKLHYKITVIMLIVFSILLTSKQYFGDPIECDVEQRRELINTYCWIYGTYTLPRKEETLLKGLGSDPNLYNERMNKEIPKHSRAYHRYYQWVCIFFFFQALTFYIPRFLWKTWEGGRLRHLVKDLNEPVVTPNWSHLAKEKLTNYLLSDKYGHNVYALRYCFCEILNLVNVLVQLYLLDWFLMGKFISYGISVIQEENDTMATVFPTIAKCTYYRYGPSGTIQNYDALCILPLNILNEKLFLVLWFWLFLLLIVTFVAFVYRIIFILFPNARVYLLIGQTRSIGKKKAKFIVKEITFGDFFIMYNIGKNVNPVLYKELVDSIYEHVRAKKPFKSFSESTRIEEA